MEDDEWIEIGLVFDQFPSPERLEALLATFPKYATPEYGQDEIYIAHWDENHNSTQRYGFENEAVETLSRHDICRIETRFDGYDISIGKNNSDGLLSQVPHLTFREQIHPFKDPNNEDRIEEIDQRRLNFVETLGDAAEILTPKWGFGRRGGLAVGKDDTVEHSARMMIPPLYEYNVFREESVEAIGRERVTTAPAWHVEELETGAVLLVVREPPLSCSPNLPQCEEVADHLGMEFAQPTRFH